MSWLCLVWQFATLDWPKRFRRFSYPLSRTWLGEKTPGLAACFGGVTELNAIAVATLPRKHETARFVQLFRITRLTLTAI